MTREEVFALIDVSAAKYRIPAGILLAQCEQESGFDPEAISECWAAGLLQLIPATAREMGLQAIDHHEGWTKQAYRAFMRDAKDERLDPAKNVDAGAHYLRLQCDHFPEIPDLNERWKFALAAYNGGRGHINAGLRAARFAEFGYQPLVAVAGKWQTWGVARKYLDGCDVLQICGYVSAI